MGMLIVDVQKSYGGEDWINTHAFDVGSVPGQVSDGDMSALGCGSTLDATTTTGTGATNPLQRLLAMERLLHDPRVTITRVFISDGKRNAVTDPDYFFSATVSLAGLAANANRTGGMGLAPGTVPLIVNRIAAGFSSREGRMFIRGLLQDDDVLFNLRGGVGWRDSVHAGWYQTIVNAARDNSNILAYFSGGTSTAVARYGIPHYQSVKNATVNSPAGTIIGITPCATLTMGNPRSRQMLRGKKRKKATTAVAV